MLRAACRQLHRFHSTCERVAFSAPKEPSMITQHMASLDLGTSEGNTILRAQLAFSILKINGRFFLCLCIFDNLSLVYHDRIGGWHILE